MLWAYFVVALVSAIIGAVAQATYAAYKRRSYWRSLSSALIERRHSKLLRSRLRSYPRYRKVYGHTGRYDIFNG